MKNIFLLSLSFFLFSACSAPQEVEISQKNTSEKMNEMENMTDDNMHMGCQESEVVDGKCVVAEEKNADIFSQGGSFAVLTEEVPYTETANGFLVRPEVEGEYPAVVMIHEWWGLNNNIKTMAKLLASEGYVVLAVDLYDGEVAETSETAGKLAGAARGNKEKSVQNMRDAISYLKTLPFVEKEKLASLGWCFGGQQSLNLSLASGDLSATVIYYGQLTDDTEKLKNISWPVLGIFGSEDTSITVESVNAFSAALNKLSIPNEIYMYEGVGHAFANPSGTRYAPKETQDAWRKTLTFLQKNLKE